ncbi:MAG: extracellular solute-binding protein [Planctomycetota bacterium]
MLRAHPVSPRVVALAALALLVAACGDVAKGPRVYCALDEQFSRPVLEQFARELGVDLSVRYDTEAAKTVGLVSMLREEREHPRCSVFWNNELAHTVRLAQEGLLEPYESPAATGIPAAFRDPEHRWTGFAARARVLVINTELLPDRTEWPKSYRDLVLPKWKGRCAVARPLTGTTLTHFTALRKALGDEAFDAWFAGLLQNDVQFLASNGATLRATASGQVAWAFTDTDDYHVGKQNGQPIACVFPDQGDGELGTMLIPNSVALIRGGPHLDQARRLVDAILAKSTEALLAASRAAQLPLRNDVQGPADPAILPVGAFRAMDWDVQWTAENLARCSQDFGKRFGL